MSAIATNLQVMRQGIRDAALASGRDPASIRLLTTNMAWPAAYLRPMVKSDPLASGKNHVQAAFGKRVDFCQQKFEWHFVGPLHGNKMHQIAERPLAQRPDHLEPLHCPFQRLSELFTHLRTEGLSLGTLSMGKSHDMNSAIVEGTTIVRVGTATFGARPPQLQPSSNLS